MTMHRNPMSDYKDLTEKRRAFSMAAANGCIAFDANGKEYSLRNVKVGDVEHIGGAWRIQNKFNYPIQIVRGEELVLGERINRVEKNLFEFYRARRVGNNCYGRFIVGGADIVVAKYETDKETHWAYGRTIEEARAFLGIRLYDKYMDLIHSVACKKKLSRAAK